ncbi:MAG: FAD:protein FMN transferase, partial [Candidatus Omnitrophota bacterium]
NKMYKVKSFAFALCALSLTFLFGCQDKTLHKDSRLMMGTFVEVTSPDKLAKNIVFQELTRVENLLSKYKPGSEISRLNRQGKLAVSPETFYILKKSQELWKLSDGAFDITVSGLVDLWGFTDKKYKVPEESEIKAALKFVGSQKIIFNDEKNVVEFIASGVKVDLGAIAKGYALDCALKKLKENNITSCLINIGGQIYCLGDRFGKPWKIAIQSPRGKDFVDFLELKDAGVATSGDYEQYFVKDNARYSHILNPKTGYPANSGIISATVITNNNLVADALSTAIFVLGKEKGMELIKKFPGTKVKIIDE